MSNIIEYINTTVLNLLARDPKTKILILNPETIIEKFDLFYMLMQPDMNGYSLIYDYIFRNQVSVVECIFVQIHLHRLREFVIKEIKVSTSRYTKLLISLDDVKKQLIDIFEIKDHLDEMLNKRNVSSI